MIVPIIEECWVVLNALQDSINRGFMGTNVADLNNLDDVDFTKLSDVGSDMDIDDFDWSDINKNGEKQGWDSYEKDSRSRHICR